MKRLFRVLPPFFLAFLTGVFVASIDVPPSWFVMLLGALSAVSLFAMCMYRNPRLPLLTFVLLGLVVGIARYSIWDSAPQNSKLEALIGKVTTLEGVVTDEPDVREDKVHLTVELFENSSGGTPVFANKTALVIVNRFPEYRYGDRILLEGKLTRPEKLIEKDGRIFDYPSYLRSKGIDYQMVFPKLSLRAHGEGNFIMSKLFEMKLGFESALSIALPSPHSALLSGLLLGGKQSLGALWLERFRVAGIVHIIVLSGYNMTVVAEWLVVLFRSLGFYGSLSVGSVGIMLFALMTGGGATVVRAAIMALIVLLAKATGRNYDMGRALLVAASLMVFWNPSILLFDPSFQLSFLASVGLIYVSPLVLRHTKLFRTMPMWREVFVSTVATQVTVLPLLMYQTGMFSIISLPANLIVLPLIPLTMLTGFIAGIVALLLPTVSVFIGLPAYALLSWILAVAEYAEKIPFAALHFGSIPAPVVGVLYVVMALIVRYEQKILNFIRLFRARGVPPSN